MVVSPTIESNPSSNPWASHPQPVSRVSSNDSDTTQDEYWNTAQPFVDQTGKVGGDIPFIAFDPNSITSHRWLSHAQLDFLDNGVLEEFWANAQSFVDQVMVDALISKEGWQRVEENSHPLDFMSNPTPDCQIFISSDQGPLKFRIPLSFQDLTDLAYQRLWKDHFSSLLEAGLINVVYSNSDTSSKEFIQLTVDLKGLMPLVNYIYLLQCIRPGMLIFGLKRSSDDPEDSDTLVHTRLLPPSDWLTRNHASLIPIFGLSYLSDLEKAAADPERSSHEGFEEYSSGYGEDFYVLDAEELERADDLSGEEFYDDDGYSDYDDPWRNDVDYYAATAWGTKEPKEFIACTDEKCGYCGKCEY